jgi:hypothetical protein
MIGSPVSSGKYFNAVGDKRRRNKGIAEADSRTSKYKTPFSTPFSDLYFCGLSEGAIQLAARKTVFLELDIWALAFLISSGIMIYREPSGAI